MAELMDKTKNIIEANQKKLRLGLILLIILAALGVGFQAMFEVEGVVTAKSGQKITVANFFRTQTVDLKGTAINQANIKIGDRIEINKNIQGKVLCVRVNSERHEYGNHGNKYDRDHHKNDRAERE